MNDIAELKQFVVVHAKAQGIPEAEYRRVLDAVEHDDGDGPGSWVRAWTDAGREHENAGRLLEAFRRHNMARFPYVDGPARGAALDRCVEVFDRWRGGTAIERLDLDLPGGRVRSWTTGLSAADPKPLLLVIGGIVSVKEQWAPVLLQAARLGLAGVVTEMPGVGENTLRYGEDSPRLLPAILDAVADRADAARTYAVALSFSGNLALHAAAADPRIRGVILAGAPIIDFFTDEAWQRALPSVTVDTLAHLTGADRAKIHDRLRPLALTPGLLASLDIPVYSMASRRDEIIPPGDTGHLRRHLKDLRLVENDDVHGSPRHFLETRLWIVRSLLELSGGRRPQRAVLGALIAAQRARARLRRSS
ncbi:esterase FrsA [Actinocorallia sp. API 0066]|uniref:alpha/beta hydrolase n=1 Tax=Actinocorallia sp. API 0066 TaxID=2896846 RepID=UPI001E61B76A|nr:alpha/beta hydrolase [Actinocorallia sp. API 0066]MCD0451746.1 esterase FrsA [Actinocorallia sp. API 0066]